MTHIGTVTNPQEEVLSLTDRLFKVKPEHKDYLSKSIPIFSHPDFVFKVQDINVFKTDSSGNTQITLYLNTYPLSYFEEVTETEPYILCKYHTSIRKFLLPVTIQNTGSNQRIVSYSSRETYYLNSNFMYSPSLTPDKDGFLWKPSKVTTKSFTKDYLKEQIRARYGFCNRPSSGLSNVVLDSFFPGLLYKYNMNVQELLDNESFPKTSVCVSPLVADLLQVKRIPTEQLIRILGYSVKDITNLLVAVKNKSLSFIFAGIGGTGMNTAYWLDELSKLTNTINIFNTISIYEKETIEFSNILRFPLPLSTYYQYSSRHSSKAYKTDIIPPLLKRLTNRKVIIYNSYISKDTYLSGEFFNSDYTNRLPSYTAKEHTVIYGAPGLEHRNYLSSIGNFVCATHASNSCSIWLNPAQTESIEIESYGSIQLGPFMMNQLRMTIGLLELLASNTSLATKDHEYLNYEFTGESAIRTDRQYNFQIQRDSLMMTPEQAMAI